MTAGERGKDRRVAPQVVSELSFAPGVSERGPSLELAGSGGACQPHPAPRTRVLFRGPACGGCRRTGESVLRIPYVGLDPDALRVG
ncbi:hypothetical protein CLOM_g8245 [Closterium sp. NIES-68]|nr:hypothetical protein CLOM_g8245 [Closterium sp. NIES-68]